MKTIGKKRLLISLILTFFIVGISAPLYGVPKMFDGIYKSRISNKKALIEITGMGGGEFQWKL